MSGAETAAKQTAPASQQTDKPAASAGDTSAGTGSGQDAAKDSTTEKQDKPNATAGTFEKQMMDFFQKLFANQVGSSSGNPSTNNGAFTSRTGLIPSSQLSRGFSELSKWTGKGVRKASTFLTDVEHLCQSAGVTLTPLVLARFLDDETREAWEIVRKRYESENKTMTPELVRSEFFILVGEDPRLQSEIVEDEFLEGRIVQGSLNVLEYHRLFKSKLLIYPMPEKLAAGYFVKSLNNALKSMCAVFTGKEIYHACSCI